MGTQGVPRGETVVSVEAHRAVGSVSTWTFQTGPRVRGLRKRRTRRDAHASVPEPCTSTCVRETVGCPSSILVTRYAWSVICKEERDELGCLSGLHVNHGGESVGTSYLGVTGQCFRSCDPVTTDASERSDGPGVGSEEKRPNFEGLLLVCTLGNGVRHGVRPSRCIL